MINLEVGTGARWGTGVKGRSPVNIQRISDLHTLLQ